MLDAVWQALFHGLARSHFLKRRASRHGLRQAGGFARRFIAGETLEDAVQVARALEAHGRMTTLDLLGESVTTIAQAEAAAREYLPVIAQAATAGVSRNLSLMLTQLGLDTDRATCVDNLRRVLDAAAGAGFFVRIDMESSHYTDVTLDIFETMWRQGYRNVGVTLQSCLYRSDEDARRVNQLGGRVSLVRGAYPEPRSVAYQAKKAVNDAFRRLARMLLADGTYPGFATHDPALIDAVKSLAAEMGITRDAFEFQMLYGVRRDLQAALVEEGYRFRVSIPFGRGWFPYVMRRLGERPANVQFLLRSLLGERS